MQLSDWSDWSLIVKRNSPSVTSMNNHNSPVGYLAILILPSLQIFKLQHTVEALILNLDNNKGCSFILKGLMSSRSENGTQNNLLALFSASKTMMSYVLDSIDSSLNRPILNLKIPNAHLCCYVHLDSGPHETSHRDLVSLDEMGWCSKKRFNTIRLAILVMIRKYQPSTCPLKSGLEHPNGCH